MSASPSPRLARLLRHALFVEPAADRIDRLAAEVSEGPVPFAEAIRLLEPHGVLGLGLRNLRLAGAVPADEEAAVIASKLRMLAAEDRRARLTLSRFLDEASRDGLQVTLLKGSSLALDVYREPGLRTQGDVDVLVAAGRCKAAIAAAGRAGLTLDERQLPAWWYRLAHFHVKLHPVTSLLKKLEIHWHLHSPALLHTVRIEDVLARTIEVEAAGHRTRALGQLDRLLHLVTHLASHWMAVPEPRSGAALTELLGRPAGPVELKWIVDVAAGIERCVESADPEEVAEMARAWSAEDELGAVAAFIDGEGMLTAAAAGWAKEMQLALRPRPARAASRPAEGEDGHRPHGALDFRIEALRRLPRWLWPPREYMQRRYETHGFLGSAAGRLAHAVSALGRVSLAGATLPAALLGRSLARRARRRRRRDALEPGTVLDLVGQWRGEERRTESETDDARTTRR